MRKKIELKLLGKKKLVSASLHETVIDTWREVANFLEVPMAEVLEMALAKMFVEINNAVKGSCE